MSVRDYLEEYFESDIVKVHLAGSAIIGTALGPYSPGSAYVLLHHYMGEVDGTVGAWGYSRGGMGSITKAMFNSVFLRNLLYMLDLKLPRTEAHSNINKGPNALIFW